MGEGGERESSPLSCVSHFVLGTFGNVNRSWEALSSVGYKQEP